LSYYSSLELWMASWVLSQRAIIFERIRVEKRAAPPSIKMATSLSPEVEGTISPRPTVVKVDIPKYVRAIKASYLYLAMWGAGSRP